MRDKQEKGPQNTRKTRIILGAIGWPGTGGRRKDKGRLGEWGIWFRMNEGGRLANLTCMKRAICRRPEAGWKGILVP